MQKVLIRDLPELSYAANEAINTLYTNLTFIGSDMKRLMFTSCHAGEGKSYITLNIARTMAAMGKKVVLVDCDLRKSQLARTHLNLDYGTAYGISHYLAGMASYDDVLYASNNMLNLYIVPCTKTVSNSLPLVSSDKFGQLLDRLSEEMDYVIVDTPPVGLLVDAAKIATRCDGTVMVVGYNTVRRKDLIDAIQQLEQSGTSIIGTVINQADFKNYVGRKYYYNKYYSNYYSNEK